MNPFITQNHAYQTALDSSMEKDRKCKGGPQVWAQDQLYERRESEGHDLESWVLPG